MPSSEIKKHWARVADVGCMITGYSNVELHHVRAGSVSDSGIHSSVGKKNSDYLVIPLSATYHRGNLGIHSTGVRTWERKNGTQIELLNKLGEILELDLFGLAGYVFCDGRYRINNDMFN